MDLEIVSENLNVKRFLFTELRVRYLGVSGKNFIIECPDPFHHDKHPSCYFHSETLVYHCFGCGAKGNIIDLVAQYMDLEFDKAEEFILRECGISERSIAGATKARFEKYNLQDVKLHTKFRRDWENANDEIKAFIERKRYNLSVFERHYVGYNNHIGSITFPVIYLNRVINVGERYVSSTSETKIKYRKGVPLAVSVWGMFKGYDSHNPFFTEGIADALRMREAGLNAYALLSIVLPNSKMRFLLDHFDGVFTIVPDPDMGGNKMIDNWKKCEHYTRVRVMQPEGDDVDATPLPEIKRLANNTKSICDFIYKNEESNDNEICEGIQR